MIDYRVTLSYNGIIRTLSDEDEPIGLEDLDIMMRRDGLYHGITPEISQSLRFHSSGYDFIWEAYNQKGIEPAIECFIEYFNGYQWEVLFEGFLDLMDAKITERYIECEVKSSQCLDLFLARKTQQVNLYDEPCFNELTSDKEAFRTRYRFAPMQVTLPEVEMVGVSSFELGDPGGYIRRFRFNGGFGCTLFICDGNPVPCGYSTACDNITGTQLDRVYLRQEVPIRIIEDDLQLLSAIPIQGDVIQYDRDCGFGNNLPFEPELDPIGYAQSCRCHSYNLTLNAAADFDIILRVLAGRVEYVRVTPRLVFEWGSLRQVITTLPFIEDSNSCAGFISLGSPYFIGSGSISGSANIVIPCDGSVKDEDTARFFVEYEIAGIFENVAGGGESFVDISTTFTTASGTISSTVCTTTPPIGDTETNVYFPHEAFSRVIEHYTNNCLRVKSDFFGRPNSMEWADDCNIQVPPCASTRPCGAFSPTPYQVNAYGCGSCTTISNGTNIRLRGTSMFVSFEELFSAYNAIYGIGVGWSAADPNNIRVENWEYFYNPNIILSIEVDLVNSKFQRRFASEYYVNNFAFGYKTWLKENVQTKKAYHTTREYTVPIKNVDKKVDMGCEFIGDFFALEYQKRKQAFTDNSSFDDSKFFICVSPNDDTNNTITTTPDNVTYPHHLFIAEQGINNRLNIPIDTINFRISPANILDRHMSYLSIGMWSKLASAEFAKGEVNFQSGGDNLSIACSNKQFGEDEDYPKIDTLIFPEIVTFEYPITPFEYNVIRFNPYSTILVNNERFFLKDIIFRPNKNSKFTLIKAT